MAVLLDIVLDLGQAKPITEVGLEVTLLQGSLIHGTALTPLLRLCSDRMTESDRSKEQLNPIYQCYQLRDHRIVTQLSVKGFLNYR